MAEGEGMCGAGGQALSPTLSRKREREFEWQSSTTNR